MMSRILFTGAQHRARQSLWNFSTVEKGTIGCNGRHTKHWRGDVNVDHDNDPKVSDTRDIVHIYSTRNTSIKYT